MTRVLAVLMYALALPVVVMAQEDDMYFGKQRRQATKITIVDASEHGTTREAMPRHRGHVRDVDEYNRRYRASETSHAYDTQSEATYYYENDDYNASRAYDEEAFCYSKRLSRFYSPGLTITIGTPWYNGYYWGDYDPFWDMSYLDWPYYRYAPWRYRFGWDWHWGWTWGYSGWDWPYYPRYGWYGWPHRDYYGHYYSYRPRTIAPRGGARSGYEHVTSSSRVSSGTRLGNATRSGDMTTRRAVTNGNYSGGSRTEGGRVITERYSNGNSGGRVTTGRDYNTPTRGNASGSYSSPTRSSGGGSGTSGGGFSGGSRGERR